MLVTRYHGVWITVPVFDEGPVIADVIADLWTTAVTTKLRPPRLLPGPAPALRKK